MMKSNTATQESSQTSATEHHLVVLELGNEVFGVDIACIHTVLMPQSITNVPKTPDYVKGVMNLRGQVLPVLDLRIRFGLPAEEHGKMRIVIVNVHGVSAGLIVDGVSEVLRLPAADIEPPAALLSSVAAECITGIGRSVIAAGTPDETQRLILLLDLDKILSNSLSDVDTSRLAA